MAESDPGPKFSLCIVLWTAIVLVQLHHQMEVKSAAEDRFGEAKRQVRYRYLAAKL